MGNGADDHGPIQLAVTGAAGYIGSHVVSRLQTEHPEWDLTALDNFFLGEIGEIGDLKVQDVDVRDRNELEAALDGADVVMHLAAISGVDDCEEHGDLAHETNVTGTNNVAWFCRKTGAGLIFPFSMGVLGDPERFPITVDLPRRPMNWYGRTKLLNEEAIERYAEGAFPAHLFMISNLYGDHRIGDQRVTKPTVINFFVDRALDGEPLTVYQPGSQARNYIHVSDVADAYLRGAERLVEELAAGETGAKKYEIASDEDPSVLTIAEWVQEITAEETGVEPPIELVENPRAGEETLVEDFEVDTSRAADELGWEAKKAVRASIRDLVRRRG